MMKQKIAIPLTISIISTILGFTCAYIFFDIKITNIKTEIIQSIKSNNMIGIIDREKSDFLGEFNTNITVNIQNAQKSIVNIKTIKKILTTGENTINERQETKRESGNGIIISENGLIISDKHFIQQTGVDYRINDYLGNVYEIQKVRTDNKNNIAIIKIINQDGETAKDMIPINFVSSSKKIQKGELIFTIGNISSKNTPEINMSIISQKDHENTLMGTYYIDKNISKRNIGGVAINIYGEAIGIIKEGNNGINLTPITKELISRIYSSIQKHGRISYPSIGITFLPITTANKNKLNAKVNDGIQIQGIIPDSEASKKGLEVGDIIVSINGNIINNENPFYYILYGYKIGEKIVLSIIKGSKKIDKDIFLQESWE